MQENTQIVLISLFALLLRWCITYHAYSGQGKPPMFGDYEAQRHWQEITLNIPIEKWYINTTDNDLQYWGLDYPPLTAYHSYVLGYIAYKINPSYVKLHESRGYSSEDHKYFMRLSVLCIDILIYIPSIIYFILTNEIAENFEKENVSIFSIKKRHINLLIILIYPGLILVDHGHFQYNSLSLGLFVIAVTAMLQNSFIIGSILFIAALNYKQMELYHALPIFCYILGKYSLLKKQCWSFNIIMLLCISITVIFTFFIIWLPFIKNWETFINVISRLFPISRGVFEDKVANIWCTVNIVYKLHNSITNKGLAKICLVVTTFAVLPSCINLYLNPQKERFVISLINCALSFFLFSFQVHEKSILLVAIPVLLYFQNNSFPCFWFLIISHFSMLPLFIKDDLYMVYCTTLIFYFSFVLWACPDVFDSNEVLNNINLKKNAHVTVNQKQIKAKLKNIRNKSVFIKLKKDILYYKNNFVSLNYNLSIWTKILFYSSMLGVIILSLISGFLEPPSRYPDLFALLVSVYSCGHFLVFYLYFNYKQFVHEININLK
ncbi:PREDICTED: dolichyl pyrophosphate Man9GlcNAc2 alpha-1,3-glucosyltransferase [Eufriesea mexicana]|uniref:dolichyl pyrophosphate Man9GlcNAc2 alpha-1,3-glucosyltransferase n=1 Tax=Eufriesea mexicana TaxID=516756 RepID=UPI00083C6EB0|nr:PREDICTED: dolichyl pyrophosphate Man9GlcNAc2 alpha-1,3-glucosyltransferase [Eufriesea mexicana]